MAKLKQPSDSTGNAPRVSGTPLPSNNVQGQGIPPAPGYRSPIISTQGNSNGDTVYFLVSNVFDPRTLQSSTFTNTYSVITPGQPYTSIWFDLLYQVLFDAFRMRNEPSTTTLIEMMEVIVDTTRMLGIYLSALTMSQSRDPDMFQRSRTLGLFDAKAEMQSILAGLCLPRYILEVSLKYIRLMDVTGSANYQNVGFLVNGDYAAFLTLFENVQTKPLARNYLRKVYPEIGLIGDPGAGMIPDVLEAFINANLKTGTGGFSPFVVVEGSSGEVQRHASFGLLHSVLSGLAVSTTTGWAVPGSGTGGSANVRTHLPSLCQWKSAANKDAAIMSTGTPQSYSVVGSTISFETIIDGNLTSNIVHEYNMNESDSVAAGNLTGFNGTTGGGIGSVIPHSAFDTRYRVSAGFELAQLSFNLQANVVTGFRDILLP